jgi:predicted nicotinamide N-methyase
VTVAGRELVITGPADPDSLLDDPALERRFETDGYMPYWATLWPASIMLAEAMFAEPPAGAGPILEVGCGLGLGGVAAGLATGRPVTFADYDADARAAASANAAANGVAAFDVLALDFRRPAPRTWDTVIAADVLYEERLRGPFTDFLRSALPPGGTAVVADPDRRGVREWLAWESPAGLAVSGRPTRAADPDSGKVIEGMIWTFTRTA